MASQAVIFAETIAGMKRAIKRKAYGMYYPSLESIHLLLISLSLLDSDSDSSIEHLTNRGNKLKKKARYVHEGQLAPPSGPLVYKRVCDSISWIEPQVILSAPSNSSVRESIMQDLSGKSSVETFL